MLPYKTAQVKPYTIKYKTPEPRNLTAVVSSEDKNCVTSYTRVGIAEAHYIALLDAALLNSCFNCAVETLVWYMQINYRNLRFTFYVDPSHIYRL